MKVGSAGGMSKISKGLIVRSSGSLSGGGCLRIDRSAGVGLAIFEGQDTTESVAGIATAGRAGSAK